MCTDGGHQRLRGRPAAIAVRIRAAISVSGSPFSWPARMAAPIVRERPAGPRRSARGLPGSLRRASHSARFSAAVPSRRWAGCWHEWLSQVWQTVGLSFPQPRRGMTPCASWYPYRCPGAVPRRVLPGREAILKTGAEHLSEVCGIPPGGHDYVAGSAFPRWCRRSGRGGGGACQSRCPVRCRGRGRALCPAGVLAELAHLVIDERAQEGTAATGSDEPSALDTLGRWTPACPEPLVGHF